MVRTHLERCNVQIASTRECGWERVCLVFDSITYCAVLALGGALGLPDPCNPGQDQTVWMDD